MLQSAVLEAICAGLFGSGVTKITVALFLGLLTPAFVACSTNAGEGRDVNGRVEEWHIPG